MKNVSSFLMVILLMVTGHFVQSCTVKGSKPEKEVLKAYELRMAGKVDEADTLLSEILKQDSTNAMAWYELARLKTYKMIGQADVKVTDILVPIEKAAILEPDNVTFAYYKGIATFLNAFMAMQMGQGEVKGYVTETITQFNNVLKLKPDYHEARMYLVEIYGLLPQEMGGDSVKAAGQAEKLELMDKYFGAKAKAVLAPESTDRVKFWEDLIRSDAKNPQLLMEAGKACLFVDDTVKAEKYFNEAILTDDSKKILILDLARYYIMTVMQNKDLGQTQLPVAKRLLEKYLTSSPEPLIPLKTYTMGLLARCEMFLGNQAEAEKLMNESKLIDPYFSRASGVPLLLLFDPPDQISHHYFSFFSPF